MRWDGAADAGIGMEMPAGRQVMQVHVGSFSNLYEALSIEASKLTTAGEIVECIADKLGLKEAGLYELRKWWGMSGGQDCKERRIAWQSIRSRCSCCGRSTGSRAAAAALLAARSTASV